VKIRIWLFPNEETGLHYLDPRKWLLRICEAEEVRKLGCHVLRRYVASILDDK
jgi:hypothetical protein